MPSSTGDVSLSSVLQIERRNITSMETYVTKVRKFLLSQSVGHETHLEQIQSSKEGWCLVVESQCLRNVPSRRKIEACTLHTRDCSPHFLEIVYFLQSRRDFICLYW